MIDLPIRDQLGQSYFKWNITMSEIADEFNESRF